MNGVPLALPTPGRIIGRSPDVPRALPPSWELLVPLMSSVPGMDPRNVGPPESPGQTGHGAPVPLAKGWPQLKFTARLLPSTPLVQGLAGPGAEMPKPPYPNTETA